MLENNQEHFTIQNSIVIIWRRNGECGWGKIGYATEDCPSFYTHACTHTHTHTHTYTCACPHTHTHTHTHKTHTHRDTHTTRTCTPIHICIHMYSHIPFCFSLALSLPPLCGRGSQIIWGDGEREGGDGVDVHVDENSSLAGCDLRHSLLHSSVSTMYILSVSMGCFTHSHYSSIADTVLCLLWSDHFLEFSFQVEYFFRVLDR